MRRQSRLKIETGWGSSGRPCDDSFRHRRSVNVRGGVRSCVRDGEECSKETPDAAGPTQLSGHSTWALVTNCTRSDLLGRLLTLRKCRASGEALTASQQAAQTASGGIAPRADGLVPMRSGLAAACRNGDSAPKQARVAPLLLGCASSTAQFLSILPALCGRDTALLGA